MPDISMCDNKACPSFEKCYRAQADPSPRRQSFGSFKPKQGHDRCDDFVEIQSGDITRFRPRCGSFEKLLEEWDRDMNQTRSRLEECFGTTPPSKPASARVDRDQHTRCSKCGWEFDAEENCRHYCG